MGEVVELQSYNQQAKSTNSRSGTIVVFTFTSGHICLHQLTSHLPTWLIPRAVQKEAVWTVEHLGAVGQWR